MDDKVSDAFVHKVEEALCQRRAFGVPSAAEIRRALEVALKEAPWGLAGALAARIAKLEAQLRGEVCDGEHEGPCPAWHDGVDGMRQRIAELEAQLAKVRRWMADDIKWRAILASKEEDT